MISACPTPGSFSIVRLLFLLTALLWALPSPSRLCAEAGTAHPRPLKPLHFFYGGKLGLSFLLAGTAITDLGADRNERAILAGSSLLLAIPSSAVWYHSRSGNPQALQRWQKISFAADITLSGSLAAYGAYIISTGDISDQWTGIAALTVGALGALLGTLNLLPFRSGADP